MSRRSVVSLAVLLVLVVAGGACADESSDEEVFDDDTDDTDVTQTTGDTDEDGSDDAWPGDGGPTETVDLGAGLVGELPEGWEVEEIADATDSLPSEVPDECTSLQGWLAPGDDQPRVDLQLHSAGCAGLEPLDQIGNGYHGTYVTLDDVQEPTGVEELGVTAGALVTFSQEYFECTNECNDYDDHVGLLTLTDPPDPSYPTLMLLDMRGERSFDQLVALADAISPA